MFEALVVPLDGSEFAAQAVPVAVAIARAGRVGLRLVGVARDDGERAAVRRYVDGTAREVPTTVVPEVDVILDDDPVRALLELAADGTSVLCLASHDRARVAAKIMHSVGSALVARARLPIVVVGERVAPSLGANDVVAAVDGVHDPLPLVATAVAWARQLRAPLRIVTVYEPTLADLDRPSHFTRHHGPPVDPDVYLGAIQRGVEEEGVASVSTAAIADPVGVGEGLVDHVADRPARLLVVGGRRHGGPDRPSGTVRGLLRTAPVPLLVVNQRDG